MARTNDGLHPTTWSSQQHGEDPSPPPASLAIWQQAQRIELGVVRGGRPLLMRTLALFLWYSGAPDVPTWEGWPLSAVLARWRGFRCSSATPAACAACGPLGRLLALLKGHQKDGPDWRPPRCRDCLLPPRVAPASDSDLVSTLLTFYPRRTVQQAVLQRLPALLAGWTVERFRELDGEQLLALLPPTAAGGSGLRADERRALVAFLRLCRRHPSMDPHGHFASHLGCGVPAALLDRWPILWSFPHTVSLWLLRERYDEAEIGHLLWLLETGALNRRRSSAESLRRSRAANGRCLALWTGLRSHFDPAAAAQTWCELLPVTASADELYQTMARIVGAHCRRSRPRALVTVDGRNHLPELLRGWIQLLIRSEVFANLSPDHRLCEGHLWRARQELAHRYPLHYSLLPTDVPRVPRVPLDAPAVQRLLEAVRTAREEVLLLLLSTLGLRIGAIATLTVADVWDPVRTQVREEWSVLEKGAVRRRCRPDERLRTAVQRYLHSDSGEHEGIGTLLFPPRRNPTVPRRSTPLRILQTVIARAGLAHRFSPHQFRKFLINHLLQLRWSLDDVAKWIGHRDLQTTYQPLRGSREMGERQTTTRRPGVLWLLHAGSGHGCGTACGTGDHCGLLAG